MKKPVNDYWFIVMCGIVVLVFFAFATVVAVAPHIDEEQRGFTPCTYELAVTFQTTDKISFMQTMKAINTAYLCYAGVMWQGLKMFVIGEQKTPWANYMFEPVLIDEPDEFEEDVEPISDDLNRANMLDESLQNTDLLQDDIKENADEENQ